MSKKSKCATALLATALLSYGFTLDTEQEITTVEPEIQREVSVEKESTPITEPQHLVVEEEMKVEIFEEEPIVEEKATSPTFPTEPEPEPTEPTPQATSLSQTQADRTQPDVPSKPVYTQEQLTDPTQTPDGTPVEVYVPEVTYLEEQTSTDLAYVPGFGWVPIPDACEVIFADDMYQNGNKVGTMGG